MRSNNRRAPHARKPSGSWFAGPGRPEDGIGVSKRGSEELVDREVERGHVAEFLAGIPSGLSGLVLEGDAGAGKTTRVPPAVLDAG